MLEFYPQTLRRMTVAAILLTIFGTVLMLAIQGPRAGGGFAAGAAISLLNFHWLKRFVGGLGGEGKKPGQISSAVLFGARYLLAGGAIYVIVKFTGIALGPVFWGLLVSAGAVFLEILYEVLFSR